MYSHEMTKEAEAVHQVPPPASIEGEVEDPLAHDAVFGTITKDGPNYRNVGWLGTAVLMIKTQIGLGVLSIPAGFDTLGLVPGLICILSIAALVTWSSFIVGDFKLRHPETYGIDDAGAIMFGRIGRELFSVGFVLYLVFCAGGSMLSISIAFNAVSTHGACTAVFVGIAAIIVVCCSSIRTLSRVSWIAWIGLPSIIIAILMVTIAVGIQDRPSSAPKEGPWKSDYKLFGNPSFTEAISAVSAFVLAYAGTPFFFPIASEMRDFSNYRKAIAVCQGTVTVVYVTIGIVVYYFCGSYVASPALGSAGPLVKKISYGFALPGLIATSTICTHLVGKHFFVRFLRGSHHLTSNTLVHWGTWIGCVSASATVSYIIASGIPIFGPLISLVGALLGTFESIIPMGAMWIYDNWNSPKRMTRMWKLTAAWAVFVVVSGMFLMIGGTYGSIVGIIDALSADGASRPWSCADNSNST